jgi:hypothetical protein
VWKSHFLVNVMTYKSMNGRFDASWQI